MSGVLYIVATPIGNLDDITLRAIDTLRRVDLVAAEDTRHTQHLLAHLGLKKKLLSLHEHNERQRIQQVVDHLQSGMQVALVSDAGTPLISDPGFPLVRAVIETGLRVTPVPGVSSIITALCAGGLATDRFCFHGFLSHKNAERARQLLELKNNPGTQVIFESTHRIQRLLRQMQQLMPDVSLVLAKELTKRYETFIRGDAAACLQALENDEALVKGEFVVLIEQPAADDQTIPALNVTRMLSLLLQEMPVKKAAKIAAELTGLRKNDLYRQALAIGAENVTE